MNDPAEPLALARRAIENGQFDHARTACAEALKIAPDCVQAHIYLGEIAWNERNLGQAIQCFTKAHRLDPRNPQPLIWLASTFLLSHDLNQARLAAERAADCSPADAESLDTLGVIFGRTLDYKRSLQFFEQATALEPEKTGYLFNLGCGQQTIGDFPAAEQSFLRCISLDPDFQAPYVALTEITVQTQERNFIPSLKRFFAAAGDNVDQALSLGHALAKSYEDLGDYKASLDQLTLAKAPRRKRAPYDGARDQAVFQSAASTFPGRVATTGAALSERPIFIVGMPRSGTTLVDRILSSHAEVGSLGEFLAFPMILETMAGAGARRLGEPGMFRRAATLDLDRVGQDYLRAAKATAGASRRTVDKLPFNFLYAGLIHRALPNARIVCLRRDPVDVCLSNYRLLFGQGSPFHDYAYDLEDIARYYVMFDKLMAHWRTHLPADRFVELGYEALVADQEAQTRRLLTFCDLEWDARCLAFHENSAGVSTPSLRQVRNPLFKTSIGRWRKYGEALAPMIAILREAGLVDGAAAHLTSGEGVMGRTVL